MLIQDIDKGYKILDVKRKQYSFVLNSVSELLCIVPVVVTDLYGTHYIESTLSKHYSQ